MERNEPSVDSLLTPAEVARLLRVTPATLANWRARGDGPEFVKLGPSRQAPVRYYPSVIDAWISSGAEAVA